MLAVDSPLAAYRAAAEAQDTQAMLACLRPDVVLTSPITNRFTFTGHAMLGPLLDDVHAVVSPPVVRVDAGDDRERLLVIETGVGRQELTELVAITLDEDGLIATLELALRPMPGLLAMAAALGPRVARRRSRVRALAVRAMIAPLAFAATSGEGVASRLAAPPRPS